MLSTAGQTRLTNTQGPGPAQHLAFEENACRLRALGFPRFLGRGTASTFAEHPIFMQNPYFVQSVDVVLGSPSLSIWLLKVHSTPQIHYAILLSTNIFFLLVLNARKSGSTYIESQVPLFLKSCTTYPISDVYHAGAASITIAMPAHTSVDQNVC